MLREFEIIIIIIIFCVFRFNGIEENRDKEGDEEKAGFEGDEKRSIILRNHSKKTKKQQHLYPILNIMHDIMKFRALF